MSTKRIIFPATVSKVMTMADNSLRINLDTQEITDPLEAAGLFILRGTYGYCMLSIEEITEEETIKFPAVPRKPGGQKSQSQRLRAAIYRLWESRGCQGDSEDHYNRIMEQLIANCKNEIDK